MSKRKETSPPVNFHYNTTPYKGHKKDTEEPLKKNQEGRYMNLQTHRHDTQVSCPAEHMLHISTKVNLKMQSLVFMALFLPV